jgi:hypothetical protein
MMRGNGTLHEMAAKVEVNTRGPACANYKSNRSENIFV